MDAIFSYMEKYDYENLFLCQDKALDLPLLPFTTQRLGLPRAVAACGSMTVRWKPLKMP